MPEVRTSETHKREIRGILNRHELARLVAQHIACAAGVDLSDKATKFKVNFREETEGSPSYCVGHGAVVEITIDLGQEGATP